MKIKIFVGYHNKSFLIKNNVFYPILLGASRQNEEVRSFFSGCALDNQGDNISDKNDKYCELTGLYNIWKNQDLYLKDIDYVGFMHYRRLLDKKGILDVNAGLKIYSKQVKNLFESNNLDIAFPRKDKNLVSLIIYDRYHRNLTHISDGDINRLKATGDYCSLEDHYCTTHIKQDFLCMMGVLEEKYPEVYKIAQDAIKDTGTRFCNMFVAKKAIFNDTMKFVFDILETVEIRREGWSSQEYEHPYQKRVAGFLSERLISIYMDYLVSQKSLQYIETKIKRLENDEFISRGFIIPLKKVAHEITVIKNNANYKIPYKVLKIFLQILKTPFVVYYFYKLVFRKR